MVTCSRFRLHHTPSRCSPDSTTRCMYGRTSRSASLACSSRSVGARATIPLGGTPSLTMAANFMPIRGRYLMSGASVALVLSHGGQSTSKSRLQLGNPNPEASTSWEWNYSLANMGSVAQTDVVVRRMTSRAAAVGDAWYAALQPKATGSNEGGEASDMYTRVLEHVERNFTSSDLLKKFAPHMVILGPLDSTLLVTRSRHAQALWRWWTCRATCCKPTLRT